MFGIEFLIDPSLAQMRLNPKSQLVKPPEISPIIPQPPRLYSYLSATMGSTFVARRAGT